MFAMAMARRSWSGLVALCAVLVLRACAAIPLPSDRWGLSGPAGNGVPQWYHQKLDHFNLTDKRTFRQRFFEVTEHAVQPDAPIVLYICGEAPCGGVPGGFYMDLVKEWGAVGVSLEHRYYGESMPFADTSRASLAFLSTQQALADLAQFRDFYQETFCAAHGARLAAGHTQSQGACGSNKWVVVGGSYAGAMSAWLRLKYPHLFQASLASSAVINIIRDFDEFDRQVLESAGPECGPLLQQVTAQAEALLARNRSRALELFQAQGMRHDRDFLFMIADAAVFAFQYGRPDSVCQPLVRAQTAGEDLLLAFANYTVDVFFGFFGGRPSDYCQEALKDTALGPRSGMRVWWYQCCTEMAYFQIAPRNNSVRSSAIDKQYWRDFCSNVFGQGVFPDTRATNRLYGATDIAGSRIFFANGSQDPWKRASKLNSTVGEPSILIPCHNCGHCVDLRGCPPQAPPPGPGRALGSAKDCSDPKAVRRARRIIRDTLTLWLQDWPALDAHNMVANA